VGMYDNKNSKNVTYIITKIVIIGGIVNGGMIVNSEIANGVTSRKK
jgi:hypothetical protein